MVTIPAQFNGPLRSGNGGWVCGLLADEWARRHGPTVVTSRLLQPPPLDTTLTWEEDDDPKPHYRAIYDDKGRMVMLECANTDFGDGWEQEASNEDYFHLFSEKQAYPMGINIVVYALTQ